MICQLTAETEATIASMQRKNHKHETSVHNSEGPCTVMLVCAHDGIQHVVQSSPQRFPFAKEEIQNTQNFKTFLKPSKGFLSPKTQISSF